MANFSGALKISDLNDFINPSQDCVKPVVIERSDNEDRKSKTGIIQIEEDGSYSSVQDSGKVEKLKKVQITLNDCLACSGCITTAETILVSQQSKDELYNVIQQNKIPSNDSTHRKVVVVSLSPPSLASLAAHYNISITHTASRLSHFFKHLGVDYVFDTTFANDLCLIQNCREFVDRYRRREIDKTALPMLASSCPGWICYAEKTHGSYILPYLSRVKSPQQIAGSLVKRHFAESISKTPSMIYHVSVMPCYDKKLEASRPDFYSDKFETRDVDCVLTTGEVLTMLDDANYPLDSNTSEQSLDHMFTKDDATLPIYTHEGGASGGYCEHITKYATKHLFGLHIDSLVYKVLRNQDMQEVTIEHNGECVLHMALAYGFRNIQIIVQKIKRGKCPYDYVEVMACPSGCNNGGGQITANENESPKDLLHRVTQSYETLQTQQPLDNPLVEKAFDWIRGCESDKCGSDKCGSNGCESEQTMSILETSYHFVPKTENLNIRW